MTKYLLRRCLAVTTALALMVLSTGGWSQPKTAAPMAGPAPQNLMAADTPDGVLLSWHVLDPQASYQVLRSLDGAAFDKPLQTLPVGAKSFLDRGFHGKASYQVVGVDGAYRGASPVVQYLPPPPSKDALPPQTLKSAAPVAKLAAPAMLAPPPPPPAAAPAPAPKPVPVSPAPAPAPAAAAAPPAKAALVPQPLPSPVAATKLLAPALLAPAAPTPKLGPSGAPAPTPASADTKAARPSDTLQQNFALDGKPPQRSSYVFGVTSPGGVDVRVDWQGAPVTLSLVHQASGQTVATGKASGASASLNYVVTPQDIAKGFLWMAVVSGAGASSGAVKAIYPKADPSLLDAHMATLKTQSVAAQKQGLPQVEAQMAAQVASKLQALQKANQDAVLAGNGRIRALAASGVQKLSLARNTSLIATPRPARGMSFAQTGISTRTLSGAASSGAPDPSDPFVNSLAPDVVRPGTVLTVDGVNFKPDDQVAFVINTQELPGARVFLSSTKFQVTVPAYVSPRDLIGYFYIKTNKYGQMVRVDSVVEVPLKATVPVIASIATADPNGSGPARPNTQILVAGSGFSPDDEVHVIINGADIKAEHAASDLNTDGQLVVTVPDATGFANQIQAPVYIKIKNTSTTSARFPMTLAPELAPPKQLHLNELMSVIKSDHGSNTPYAGSNAPSQGGPDDSFSVIVSPNYIYDGWVYCTHLAAAFWGFRGDDTYFNNFALKNNWTVKEVLFNPAPHGSAGVSLVDSRVGTSSLYVKIHWWDDASFNGAAYYFTYIVEGPKGTDYK